LKLVKLLIKNAAEVNKRQERINIITASEESVIEKIKRGKSREVYCK